MAKSNNTALPVTGYDAIKEAIAFYDKELEQLHIKHPNAANWNRAKADLSERTITSIKKLLELS